MYPPEHEKELLGRIEKSIPLSGHLRRSRWIGLTFLRENETVHQPLVFEVLQMSE